MHRVRPYLAVKAASKEPKKDHALRYHSLHDNTYLRYFIGRAATFHHV
jgi:hypothetical protein